MVRTSVTLAIASCAMLCLRDTHSEFGLTMGYVFILTDFNKVMFSCFIPDINQCVDSYFETGKVEFVK